MARRTSGEREQFWRDLIGRQPASGMSISRFCQEAGVSANSFFVWRRRLRRPAGQTERGPRTSPPRKDSRDRSSLRKAHPIGKPFVPVRLIADPLQRNAPQAATIEVEWPSGLVLRVPAGFDVQTLRDVLDLVVPAADTRTRSC